MKNKQVEDFKTGVIIFLSILVVIGGIYIASDKVGSHDYSSAGTESGTTSQDSDNPLLAEGEVIKDDEQGELTNISIDDIKKAISDEKDMIAFLGSETCGWCKYQKPILKHIIFEKEITISYLNVGAMSEEEYKELAKIDSELESFGTPTFVLIKNGEIKEITSGARGTAGIEEMLRNNDLLD